MARLDLIRILLVVAAVALLPGWLLGPAALGAALGLCVLHVASKKLPREVAQRDNVIHLSSRRSA